MAMLKAMPADSTFATTNTILYQQRQQEQTKKTNKQISTKTDNGDEKSGRHQSKWATTQAKALHFPAIHIQFSAVSIYFGKMDRSEPSDATLENKLKLVRIIRSF